MEKQIEKHKKEMEWIMDTTHICQNSQKAQSIFMRLYAKHGKPEYLQSAELESKIQKRYCGQLP